jgi:hypothetical protein
VIEYQSGGGARGWRATTPKLLAKVGDGEPADESSPEESSSENAVAPAAEAPLPLLPMQPRPHNILTTDFDANREELRAQRRGSRPAERQSAEKKAHSDDGPLQLVWCHLSTTH